MTSFIFSSSSRQISSLNWLWLRGCMPCNAEEPVEEQFCLTQPHALLQGGMCAGSHGISWPGAGCSQVSTSQGRSSFFGADRSGVVRLGSGCSDVLGGKQRFPLLPAFTAHLPPGNLMSQTRPLLIGNPLLELMHLLGNLILHRGGIHEGTQSMGSVTPMLGEWEPSVWWRGKSRTRWLRNYPWPQEGGLRWHLFWQASYFEVREGSVYMHFSNSSQKHKCWNIRNWFCYDFPAVACRSKEF